MIGKSLTHNTKLSAFMFTAFSVLLVSGFVAAATAGGGAIMIGAGILGLVIEAMKRSTPVVQIHEDHVELKLGPLSRRRFVLYKDLHSVERTRGGLLELRLRPEGDEKVRIVLNTLQASDRDEFVDFLTQQVGTSS